MKLESGLDEGPVYKMAKLAIQPQWNKKDLFDALAVLGADCLLETLAEIDSLTPVAQDHANATYAPMFGKQDGCIDFAQPAKVLVDLSRALEPDDSIYTFINNKRIAFKSVAISDNIENKSAVPGTVLAVSKKSIDIATGDGTLHVTEVQPAGKKPMAIQSFLNGHPLQVGDRFLIES